MGRRVRGGVNFALGGVALEGTGPGVWRRRRGQEGKPAGKEAAALASEGAGVAQANERGPAYHAILSR